MSDATRSNSPQGNPAGRTRYLVDSAEAWRDEAAGLSAEEFLEELKHALVPLETLPSVEAENLIEAAEAARIVAGLYPSAPITVLLYNPKTGSLHRMRQVVTFEECP